MTGLDHGMDRRTILRTAGVAAVSGAALSGLMPLNAAMAARRGYASPVKWEEGPMRWFQLAFTEDDPGKFSPQFWLDYFREIKADGVCLSAGGGVAFYPTKVPNHGKARGLGDQNPFGTMVKGCKDIGMRVLARIDTHAMPTEVFQAHPEWAACTADGKPRKHWTAPDLYLTCPYTDYNFKLMPPVLAEIARNYQVDGFFGNRVNTLGVCYCNGCRTLYRSATGAEIPTELDPIDPAAARYWNWTQSRLLLLNDLWNATIRKTNPNGFFVYGTERRGPVDYVGKDLGDRNPVVFCDRQARSTDHGLFSTGEQAWNNGRFTKELRAYMGDKPVSNIISVGVEEEYRWKDSVQNEAEIRIWAHSAIAQGSRPWVTKFNAKPFDKRWMPVVSDIYQWLAKNETYLRNTKSLVTIGMILDPRTAALEGGTKGRGELEQYRYGFYEALLESRLPFDELDISYLDAKHIDRFRVLILPNLIRLSDAQCETLRAFLKKGGRIVATHETSLHDETGRPRTNFGLADLFGCRFDGKVVERVQNSYLTLRHPSPILAGLESIPRCIGAVKRVMVTPDGVSEPAPLTLVPSYEDLPMERVFTDTPMTDIPMAYCRTVGAGRVVYLPMDLDRTFGELRDSDHLAVLRALVGWAHGAPSPLQVTGPGMIDVAYWQQANSVAAHIVNYNNPMTMAGSYREALVTGPYDVELTLPEGARPIGATLLESGQKVEFTQTGQRLSVRVPSIRYHEIVAVDLA
jgi:hypothetical protein